MNAYAVDLIKPATGLPQDIDDWVERHRACEHFASEGGEGLDARALFLQLRTHQACFGILEEYQKLTKTYARDKRAITKLAEVDVSWLGQTTNGGFKLPLPIAEIRKRSALCEDIKNKKAMLNSGEWGGYIAETYGEVCYTINRDRDALMRRYKNSPGLVKGLRSVSFRPF
jgi:hypothetical protein